MNALTFFRPLSFLVCLALAAMAAHAETPAPPPVPAAKPPVDGPSSPATATPAAPTAARTPVVYVPPKVGAPKGRVGGGSRGPSAAGGDQPVNLAALAPEHPGLTINEQPALFWYLSQPVTAPVEFTLMTDESTRPVFETRIADTAQPGIGAVRLKDFPVRLDAGQAYRWYVGIVPDPERRSRDILAGGVIERVAPGTGLEASLAKAAPGDAPRILAEAGLWYDAINALSALIDAAPADAGLHEERASLLDQVGLPDAAAYDRAVARGR